MLISPSRCLVVQVQGFESQLGQGVQLRRLAEAVVICVLPKSQISKHPILAGHSEITVTTLISSVEFCQCDEAVASRCVR